MLNKCFSDEYSLIKYLIDAPPDDLIGKELNIILSTRLNPENLWELLRFKLREACSVIRVSHVVYRDSSLHEFIYKLVIRSVCLEDLI